MDTSTSITKKEIILEKFSNFIKFLKDNSEENQKINDISSLSIEELINGYLKNLNKFEDIKQTSIELIIYLNIIPIEANILKIEKYLTFFHEVLNL